MHDTLTDEPNYGTGKKKLSVYVLGMALCIVLTLIPFLTLMYATVSEDLKVLVIAVSAFLQFLVQVICFLRLNAKDAQSRMNLWSFVFVLVILVVLIASSVWIMTSLHCNMMMGHHSH